MLCSFVLINAKPFYRLGLAYLMVYNLACCVGWAYVLMVCVKHIANDR